MNYAIVKIGGHQYKVKEKDVLEVEKIEAAKVGKKIIFDNVLLLKSAKKTIIGQPFVAKAKIEAEVVANFKDKKVRVVKFKAKSRYRRASGHRQEKTRVKILKIYSSA